MEHPAFYPPFTNGRNRFPKNQLIGQNVLHGIEDDFFDAAPLGLHVINGDAIG
jgi:hypothetical protein